MATTDFYTSGVPTPEQVETFRELLGHIGGELDMIQASLEQRYKTGPRDRFFARERGQEPPPESAELEPMTEAELGRTLHFALDLANEAEKLAEYASAIRRLAFNGYNADHDAITDGHYAERAAWHDERAAELRRLEEERAAREAVQS